MDIVQTAETAVVKEAEAVYGKLVNYVETEVVPFLSKEEAQVAALVKPIIAGAKTAALSSLAAAAEAFLVAQTTAKSLGDTETDFLNALEAETPELLQIAKDAGSQVLQGLIGLTIAKLAAVA